MATRARPAQWARAPRRDAHAATMRGQAAVRERHAEAAAEHAAGRRPEGKADGLEEARGDGARDGAGNRFRRCERLTGGFQRVFKEGYRYDLEYVSVTALSNRRVPGVHCRRLCVRCVKAATTKRAVHRNKFRRRVREVFRTNKERFPPNVDIVVSAREGAVSYELKGEKRGNMREGKCTVVSYEALRADLLAWADSVRDKSFVSRRVLKRQRQRQSQKAAAAAAAAA